MTSCHASAMVPILAASCLLCSAASAPASPRIEVLINESWSFALEGGEATEAGGSASAEWTGVDLPHTWNVADSRDEKKPYHRGTGRYRKSLLIEPGLAGKRLYLHFEGANQIAEVAINGRPAGRHVGGYSAFAFDITDLVRIGERNEIEVRVDNRHNGDIPPLNADFTFYGGIYRDARLLALDPVHFRLDDYAATDLRISPLAVSAARATIAIDASVANASAADREVRVDSMVVDAAGRRVAGHSIAAAVDAGGVSELRLARFDIDEPHLWSPEAPYLYRVICTIRAGQRVLDRLEYPLGLRWFEFDATGFRLNGRPYRLFGTNRHQDYQELGNALPDELHRADIRRIKDNGFNFVRLAHYPQDPAVLEAADETGLLVWEETPIVNVIGTSAAFRRNSTRMLREMIRQHRHHPSVIFWGYMNEVTLVAPEPLPASYYEVVLSLAEHLNGVAREEDPLRPTVMALSYDELDRGVALRSVPDILALNLYFGWYYGELESLGPFLDRYRRVNPDVPLFVSEYGAGSDRRLHSLGPERFDFSTEYQQRFHETAFGQILDRPWLVGSAVWSQFDFGSHQRQDTLFGVNQKGLWYYDRRAKDVSWFYKARLVAEPVLRIAARDWPRRAGSLPGDAAMPVRIYSNESPVELFVNGNSLGSKPVHSATAVWEVHFSAGENVLSARSATREDRVTVYYEDRSSLFSDDPLQGARLAVNAGANEQFIDGDGLVWEADRQYSEGGWGHVGGSSERSHRRVFDTDDDPLYQTRRIGAHSYRFDVANGTYRLGLRLAELDDTRAASDGFRVIINGVPRAVPRLAPCSPRDVEWPIEASDGQGLTVAFPAGAFVNGIVLEPTVSGEGQNQCIGGC